jgi:hypothetical protein
MKSLAKLIHNTPVSYLPTKFPVHYYGMPNGKVYLIFARFYKSGSGKTGVEYVFAEHREFLYDYENSKLVSVDNDNKSAELYNESIDKPNPKIKIQKIYKRINSFAEARNKLNEDASKIQTNKVIKIGNSLRLKNHKQIVSA